MERYICIHGHFYQPPRENPWLETVEVQDSAQPYHDWNQRVTAECYAPNARSRILDEKNQIVQIANNYSKISFNFGPTLISWIEKNAADLYQSLLEADKESQKNYSGHGSALAQAYNHMILPLANHRDKYTQIIWGIRDFEYRFERKPEGMWLPETAVDLETLDILSQLGIRFTILAPHQARRIRPIGSIKWQDVGGSKIDPTMAYKLRLPSGRDISLFFYDGPISRAVAFENLLGKGEAFIQRLMSGFSESRTWPQIVHIATDGETYGHHHRFGDMALAYALNYIETKKIARLTNYGEYLEKCPPFFEVEIDENTSWSCTHGVERWRSNCGCNVGGHAGWSQAWRTPLRDSLDWLRDAMEAAFEKKALSLLKDPWEARNDYIHIVVDRSPKNIENFLNRHALHALDNAEIMTVRKLMGLERHAMLMYTSCGWFFDELTGIETLQNLSYAARVLQLAKELFGYNLEPRFLPLLSQATSNLPEFGDGRRIYDKIIKPSVVNLEKVGAHYAISSLFDDYPEKATIFCFTAEQEDYQTLEAGKSKLVIGNAWIASEITNEKARLSFGVIHFGDHNLSCGVREYQEEGIYQALVQEAFDAFKRGNLPEVVRVLDKYLGTSIYSLRSLFRDEQRKVLDSILGATLADAESHYRDLYENHVPLMRFLKDAGIPAPKALYMAAELVLNESLRQALENEDLNPKVIKTLLEEAKIEGITLYLEALEYSLRKNLDGMAELISKNPLEVSSLKKLDTGLNLLPLVPFTVTLWKIQNLFYDLLQNLYPTVHEKEKQYKSVQEWERVFTSLCEKLSLLVH